MPLAGKFLDDRWKDFTARVAPVLATHPDLGAFIQAYYKRQFEQRVSVSRIALFRDLAKLLIRRPATQTIAGPVDVVFWLDSDREVLVEAIVPVWKSVQSKGLRTVLLVSPSVAAALKPLPGEALVLEIPRRRGEVDKWKRAFADLCSVFPELNNPSARNSLLILGRQADSAASEIERVFAQLRPRYLVLPVDQFMPGSSACLVAKRMGVPSLVLLHGAISPYNAPVTADAMAVWGELSRAQMLDLGVPGKQLVVLGSPRHDQLPGPNTEGARKRLIQKLGCDDRPCLTFFSNGNDVFRNTREAVFGCGEWLDTVSCKLRGVNILVRLHPNEDGSMYDTFPLLRLFKDECDLGTTMAGSDIVAALCSTALLEGLLYGKPVYQFHAEGWPDLADNWRRGLATRVASASDLESKLDQFLRAVQPRSAFDPGPRDQVFANWGHATEAVAQHIVQGLARCRS